MHKKTKLRLQEIFKNLSPEAAVKKWIECVQNEEYDERIPFLYDELDDIYTAIAGNFPKDNTETFHAIEDLWYFLTRQNKIPADYRNGMFFGYSLGFKAAYSLIKWWEEHPEERVRLEKIKQSIGDAFKSPQENLVPIDPFDTPKD